MNTWASTPNAQRGTALVVVVIGLLAIVGMAGLALDMGHAYLNKTRLQNALDAAALSGAKIINDGGGVAAAQGAAEDTFGAQVGDELANAGLTPAVEFSADLDPWITGAGDDDARFVRVSVNSFPMTVWLARVLPGVGNSQAVAGAAVAGPATLDTTGPTCDILPVVMCAKDTTAPYYGYPIGEEEELCLKSGSPGQGKASGSCDSFAVGSGNFQLIELGCGSGGDCVRRSFAGEFPGCLAAGDGTVTSEPGNKMGPTVQGINTRFGKWQGAGLNPVDHPPDKRTTNPGVWYQDYPDSPETFPDLGVDNRRVVAVPYADCDGTASGSGSVEILDLGCLFLTREAKQGAGGGEIYGQLVDKCQASGPVSPVPGAGPLYKIVLYKDPVKHDA